MSFKEKNITVTLINFSLIMVFYLIRMFQMLQNDTFNADNLFRVWGIVVFCAIVVSIVGIILSMVIPAIIEARKTGNKEPDIDQTEDERDKMIDLRGTKATYTVSSIGSGIAMLTFVFGQSPLVMFSLLIFFGVFAQIVGDIRRLLLYREGF